MRNFPYFHPSLIEFCSLFPCLECHIIYLSGWIAVHKFMLTQPSFQLHLSNAASLIRVAKLAANFKKFLVGN